MNLLLFIYQVSGLVVSAETNVGFNSGDIADTSASSILLTGCFFLSRQVAEGVVCCLYSTSYP